MPIFYEVATLDNPADEPFALIRIDTDKRVGAGCEGIVVSQHWTKDEAKAAKLAADLAGCADGGRA